MENVEDIKLEKPNLFNIEAEQIVLGTIILNNDYLGKVNDILKSENFYEPAHQKIYDYIIQTTLRSNIVADSITLKLFFDNDETISKLGGSNYLSVLLNNILFLLLFYDEVLIFLIFPSFLKS